MVQRSTADPLVYLLLLQGNVFTFLQQSGGRLPESVVVPMILEPTMSALNYIHGLVSAACSGPTQFVLQCAHEEHCRLLAWHRGSCSKWYCRSLVAGCVRPGCRRPPPTGVAMFTNVPRSAVSCRG